MTLQLAGIHHLTAITANAPANRKFYTETLGMRLVKKTVNQDDTSAYHLFYADGQATPGSDLTFFDWPTGRERRGTQQHRPHRPQGFRRSEPGLVEGSPGRRRRRSRPIAEVGGRWSLDFEDPEGQRFRLVDDGGKGEAHPWDRSPVAAEHQIRGLGPITISVPDITQTALVLTKVLNMREAEVYASPDGNGEVHVFAMGEGGAAAELHVAVQPGLPRALQGAGGVHHVAFRTPDLDSIHEWTERLQELSPAVERRSRALSISVRSTSANPTASCSRSPPTGRDLRPTSRWKASASGSPCRHSWSRAARPSRPD